jgi:hypothetical protein
LVIVRVFNLEKKQILMACRTAMPSFSVETARRILDLFVATSDLYRNSPYEDFILINEIRNDLQGVLTDPIWGTGREIRGANIRTEKRRRQIKQQTEREEKVLAICEATKKLAAEAQRLVHMETNDNGPSQADTGTEDRKRKREDSEALDKRWEDLDALDKQWEELEALRKKLKE